MHGAHKKTLPPGRKGLLSAKVITKFLVLAEVRMRRSHGIRAIFAFIGTAKINRIAITTFLAIVEDKAISAYPFFFNQVSYHFIYMIPAQLLFFFCWKSNNQRLQSCIQGCCAILKLQ